MTRNDVLAVMSRLKTAYHSFCRDADPEAALRLWHSVFQDADAAQVNAAVDAYIASDTRGFPPSPGQIRAKLPNAVPAGWARQAERLRRYAELKQRRREAGVPPDWRAARANGLTAAEYAAACDAAGLGVEVIL